MKKFIKFVLVVVVLAIVGVVALYFSINTVVRQGVTVAIPPVTGTDASLEKASISLFSGAGTLEGFEVENPEGFNSEHAVRVGTMRVQLESMSVFSDLVVIDEIFVDGPSVIYEVSLGSTNIGTIQRRIDEFAKKQGSGSAGGTGGEGASTGDKRIRIKRLVLQNGTVHVRSTQLAGKSYPLPLPAISLNDIGGEQGLSIAEVADAIANPITRTIETVVQGADTILKEGIPGLEKVTGKIGSIEAGVKEEAERTLDRLKGSLKLGN